MNSKARLEARNLLAEVKMIWSFREPGDEWPDLDALLCVMDTALLDLETLHSALTGIENEARRGLDRELDVYPGWVLRTIALRCRVARDQVTGGEA